MSETREEVTKKGFIRHRNHSLDYANSVAMERSIDSARIHTQSHVPGGSLVEYVVTLNGPEPAGEETAPPDYGHYIEHQIMPVADAILRFLGTSFDSILDSRRQLRLL